MTSFHYERSSALLSAAASRLLIVDVQEKLIPLVQEHEKCVWNCRRLLEGAATLNVPVHATEQYPKGLGSTIERLSDHFCETQEKLRFSAAEVLEWQPDPHDSEDRHQIVVAGIEAHVCILQTAMDLLGLGFSVFVPVDAVSSRSSLDKQVGLDRLRDHGATLVTTEAVLFEWCEVAGTPEFKKISKLIASG